MKITIDTVQNRLAMLGYELLNDQVNFLQYTIDKTLIEVKHYLHRENIPENANPFIIDWICGEFLLTLFGMGQLNDSDYVISPMQSVRAGDTQITFMNYDKISGFHQLIDQLIQKSKDALQYWRVLKTW